MVINIEAGGWSYKVIIPLFLLLKSSRESQKTKKTIIEVTFRYCVREPDQYEIDV